MLQQDQPDDYVIASGMNHSVRDFVQEAFGLVGLDWHEYVEVDKAYMRPADVTDLRGDSSKAAEKLGWKPTITFSELVREMVQSDLELEGLDPAKHMGKPPASVAP
jgi:GDPmannose 4,6-dehydratase